jgi:enterochelin esterase-like enzyme
VVESQASAWAPNPQQPPYFFDLPFDADGNAVAGIAEKWTANSALVMMAQYVPALQSFRGIALDVGSEDGLAAGNRQLSESLTRLGVKHDFVVYAGNHGNRVGARFIANVLSFFEKHLDRK